MDTEEKQVQLDGKFKAFLLDLKRLGWRGRYIRYTGAAALIFFLFFSLGSVA